MGVEAGAEFQQCGNAASGLDVAAGGGQCAADHLQQSRFAAAIAADDTDGFALFDLERDVIECPEFAKILFGCFAPSSGLKAARRTA